MTGTEVLASWIPLPRTFYARETVDVATSLIGKLLVRVDPPRTVVAASDSGRTVRVARIVEVEAYLGERDAASHARRGPTPRAAIMFGPPGFLYVYLVYGMHHCMNVVTEAEGTAGAVLLRAAEPVTGFEVGTRPDAKPMSGPGKLCAALGITRSDNGIDLCAPPAQDAPGFFLADDGVKPARIKRSPRIGVDYAGAWSRRLLRYYVPGNAHVSGRPRA